MLASTRHALEPASAGLFVDGRCLRAPIGTGGPIDHGLVAGIQAVPGFLIHHQEERRPAKGSVETRRKVLRDFTNLEAANDAGRYQQGIDTARFQGPIHLGYGKRHRRRAQGLKPA